MSESGLMKPVKMCSCGSNEHVNLLVDVHVVQVLVFLYIFSVFVWWGRETRAEEMGTKSDYCFTRASINS